MEKNKNLKEIIKSLISFSFPLILSGVLQQLYNWVDAFIFGNVNGEISLAAIGSITTPINFFITIITGFTLGLSVLIAKNFFLRIACFYPVYDLAIAFRSYLEGKDDLLYSSMAGVAALVIRIISSYAMTSFYGNMVIAYAEMFSQAKALAASQKSMIPFVAAAIFYYVFNYVVAFIMEFFEKKMSYYH